MAAPLKKKLDYFPLDNNIDTDEKVSMIIGEYGMPGEFFLIKLYSWCYSHSGYYIEWTDATKLQFKQRYAYCTFNIKWMDSVVSKCIQWGIFNGDMYTNYNCLTSERIQDTWRLITVKRKGRTFKPHLWLIPETTGLIPEETSLIPEETDKVKRKENESEVNKTVSAPVEPVPTTAGDKSVSEKEPYWTALVDTWHKFGIEKFNEPPSFKGKEPKIFKQIIELLKKRAANKNELWSEETAPARLRAFLDAAHADKWLCENFLLSNLEKQFDKIIQNQKASRANVPVPPAVQPAASLPANTKIPGEIKKLYADYLKGLVTVTSIDVLHFNYLNKTGHVGFTTEQWQAIGTNAADFAKSKGKEVDDSLIQRFAVLEVFRLQQIAGKIHLTL